MKQDAVVKLEIVKVLDFRDGGQAVLEELLLKGARQISELGPGGQTVWVRMDFEFRADQSAGCLVITTQGEIERAISVRVPLPRASGQALA